MSDDGASKLPELKSDNYPLWSRKINAYLRQHLLFNLVHGLEPRPTSNATNQREWDNKEMKAAGVIEQSLDESNASHCEGLFGNAIAMWQKLEQIHNAKTPGTRFNAIHSLFSIRKEDDETLEALMTRTKATMQRVKSLRPTPDGAYTLEMLDNELVIATLLQALPDSFNHVTSSLYIQSDLSLEMLERAFLSEDVHRKQQATSDPATALRAFTPHHTRSSSAQNPPRQNSNNRPWCEHCQSNTHWERKCWHKNPSLRPHRFNTHANAVNAVNANTANADTTDTHTSNASTYPPPEALSNLNCDTGATRIMMGDEHFFASLRPLVREIQLADGASIYSKGEGDVSFQPWINGKFSTSVIIFPNVLFAPDLKSNLISVLSLVRQNGYEIRINSQQMEFYHGGELRMTARIDENCIAYLNGRVLTAESALAASTCPLDRALWHRRLGHFHHAGIDKIIRNNLVEGLDLNSNSSPDPICVPCISGKQTRAVHTTPMPRADNVLDRVFMDLHGPIPVEAIPERSKYWFPIVDDMSGYTHIYLLRKKDAALEAFKRFKASAENQTDRKIKHLRDDKGGEFISKEFEKLCENAGIIREHTHRATPEQNGVVERINRRISEGATALLTESNLPPSFWGLAVLAYVHVMNRCPSRSRGDKTPYELFHKKKPSVKKFRVFGCAAYIHVQKEQRRALESHTQRCIFVGYPSERPGWMFWDPTTRKLVYSDSAVFDEREFPGTSQPKDPIPNLLPDIVETTQLPTDNEAPLDELAILVAGRPITHPDTPNGAEYEPQLEGNQVHHNDGDDDDDDDEGEDEINFARALATSTLKETTSADESQPSSLITETIYIPLVDAVEYALSAMETEPRTLAEAMKRPDAEKYIECAIEEVKAHLENGTWKVVRLPKGKRAIGSRWVFKIKRNADGSVDRYKGRIVAKGYSQREGVDYTETFAPTARFGAVRAVIALAAIEDMELESIDIATAFLNGEIDAEVYMTKPEGLEMPGYEGPEWVLRLLKALYGIKQGPRCWSKRLHVVMTEIGFRRLECDHSVFVYERDGVKIIVPVHVDDLVLASKSKEAIEKVKRELKEKFKLREQGATSFLLGVQLERDREKRTILLSQPTYIDSLLKTYRMANCNGAKTPMAEKPRLSNKMSPTMPEEIEAMKNVPYREAVGKLLYLSIATRPDIAYAVSVLCRFTDNPGRAHWDAIKRVLRYLKHTQHYKLVYSPTGSNELFITHSDADLGGNVDNARSTAGFVISIGGGAVLWSSRLQRQVSMSSTEAEYTTAAATGTEIMWMREFFDKIGYDISKPSPLYLDNASAIQVAKNPEHQSTMKHVHRSHHWLRERVEEGDIRVQHVPGAENVADIFTKPLGPTKFELCCKLLGLRK